MRDIFLAVALLAFWSAAVVARYWDVPALDMTGLYFASVFFERGEFAQVYSDLATQFLWRDPPDAWEALAVARDYPTDTLTDYVYPPLWAAVFAPIADATAPHAFFNAARIVNMGAFCAGIVAAWDIAGRPVPVVIWAAIAAALIELTSFGYLALDLAQPQFMIVGLLLIGFAGYQRGWSLTAGAILALVAAIKITPAVFAVIFIADRNWRALTGFAGVGAALACLSILLAGWSLHEDFLDRLGVLGEVALFSHINLSLSAFANLISDPPGVADPWAIFGHAWSDYRPYTRTVGTAVTLIGLAVAYVLRRRNQDAFGLCLTIALISVISLLGSPLGWLHYLIILAPLAPALFARLDTKAATLAIVALAIVFNEAFFDHLLAQHVHLSMIYNTLVALALAFCISVLGLRARSAEASVPT